MGARHWEELANQPVLPSLETVSSSSRVLERRDQRPKFCDPEVAMMITLGVTSV